MTNLHIVRRRPEHDERIFALYGEVFGQDSLEKSRKRFDWQYFQNPDTGEDGPVILVAMEGDAVLGQIANMTFPFWWGDREVRAGQCIDYFVRPDTQGKGVGKALCDRCADEVDVVLALGLTPSSYPLFRKMYTDIGPVPSFMKILDGRALARKKWGAAGQLAGPFVDAGIRLFFPTPGLREDIEVREVSEFVDEYDDLWRRARGSFVTTVRRDARYLRWKYSQCPFRQYRVLEARRHGALAGFAVVRVEGKPEFRRGILVDLFCDASDRATVDALLAAANADFKRDGVARVEAYCYSRLLAGALKRHGFRPGRTTMQYCVSYRGTPDGRGEPKAVIGDLSNWNLFIGDGDLDRA